MAGRKIEVSIVGDSKDFERAMGRAGAATKTFGQKVQTGMKVAGLAIAGGLAVAAKIGWDELAEGQKVAAQTSAVLKSTGGAANVTAGHVEELAEKIQKLSGADDEAVQAGQNLLLTFTNVRNEVGKGNDVFDQATMLMADMSTALGQDATQSALLLGKALNDPTRGLTALRRVGVSFTKAQEKQIKKLQESGDVMGAQKVILKELTKEFGGSAKAAGETLPGKLAIARGQFENLAGSLLESLIPVLTVVAEKLTVFAGFLSKHPELAKALAVALGVLAGALLAASVASTLLNLSLLANPVGLVVLAVVALAAGLVVLYKRFETVRNIVGFLRDHWKLLLFAFGLLPGVIMLIVTHFGTLKAKAMPIIDAIKLGFDKVKTAAVAMKDFIVGTLWPKVQPILSKIETAVLAVRDAFQFVISKVQTLIGWIDRIPSPGSFIPDVGGGVPFVPGIASGGDISRSGLAVVHRGERVLPARVANRGGRSGGMVPEVRVVVVGGDRQAITWLQELNRSYRLSGGQSIL